MSYLDVITLERARKYLRLDACLIEDDNEIVSMINGACRFVEKRTNHIFYPQDKTYRQGCQVKVYDYPINDFDEYFVCHFSTYVVFPNDTEVTLNVGYENPEDVPDELIQACLQMIKVWYYESEKQVNTTLVPESVLQAIDVNRRFI
jgi:hypothetical protein